jgi:hypothetical protein
MRKRWPKPPAVKDAFDLLESLRGEIAEGAEILRAHYPDVGDGELRNRAQSMLRDRYAKGRWPTNEEIKAGKNKENERAADRAKFYDWLEQERETS